jgi:hypothetical protein
MKTQTILFVDDEREVIDALMREVRHLCREEHLLPATAHSAAEALEFLEESGDEVAILVSDLKMPGLKGGDFLRVVADRWPKTVTLVLTGNANLDHVQDFLDAGVQTFLTKPWDRDRLALEIRRALQVHQERIDALEHHSYVEEELKRTRRFHDRIARGQLPRDPRLGIDLHSSISGEFEFGGEFVDLKRIDDDRFLLIMADVAGHSIDARYVVALIQAIVESDFPDYLREGNFSPENFADWFNKRLCTVKPGGERLFVALLAMEFDLGCQMIRWVNAGQPPFVVESSAGKGPDFITATSKQYPLGVFDKSIYKQEILPFPPGARVLLFTDGVHPEGLNLVDYDPDGSMAVIRRCLKERLDASETANYLCHELGLNQKSDDLSLVLIEHLPSLNQSDSDGFCDD